MKIIWFCNVPAPYRIDFFNEISKKCDLEVFFEREIAKDRNTKWFANKPKEFKYTFLKSLGFKTDSGISLNQFKYIFKNKKNIIIIGNYSTPIGMLSILFMKILKIKFLINADGGFIKEKENIFMKYVKKSLISSADSWISSGEYTSKYFIHYGAKKEKIFKYNFTSIFKGEILNQSISKEKKSEIKRRLRINERKVIISVGRIIPEKGFVTLLEAMKEVSDEYGLYIVGGSPSKDIIDFYGSSGIPSNIHFIDFLSKEELIEYYKSANLFVLPTKGDVWGLVVNEAMSNGLPIITSDKCIAGLELVKENKNGDIFTVDNSSLLSTKIKKILENDDLMEKMSHNSLEIIKEYTIEKMAKQHIDIFTKYYMELDYNYDKSK